MADAKQGSAVILEGLRPILWNSFFDQRGFFQECYRKSHYLAMGISCDFVQDNLSFSKKGVLRGMHFQTRARQVKLISVLQGEIFDVAVDIRPNSPSFGHWQGFYLKGGNEPQQEKQDWYGQLFIAEGFAHGFCVLSEAGAYVHYKSSTFYSREEEKRFRFDDPFVEIDWPCKNPLLSLQDREASSFRELFF